MNQSTNASPANGASTSHELFALTDEQILEIQPEEEVNVAPGLPAQAGEARDPGNKDAPAGSLSGRRDSSSPAAPRNDKLEQDALGTTEPGSRNTSHKSPVTNHDSAEPPPWLAAQMKDPWNGEAAKELWNGFHQAQQEAAAYRATFATPEDARALKELYPGGVNEARTAANRARLLDQIDQAYFGAAGGTAEQTSAARAQLAAMMLREDPAAFREMVFAGLRALEEAEKGSGTSTSPSNLPRLAQVFAANRPDARSGVGATLASPAADDGLNSRGGASPAPTMANGPLAAIAASGASSLVGAQHAAPLPSAAATNEAHVAAYAAFEKAANEDLERTVGAAIERTLQQALPNLKERGEKAAEGARHGVPLQDRLSAAVRQDIEAALKGDRQLGEQIAQILSARRFDSEARAQVVRLIDDRARQLLPSAAKHVINDWTQTTLAVHRGSAVRVDAASRSDIEPALAPGNLARGNVTRGESASPAALSSRTAQTRSAADPHRNASRSDARRVDYRKLSDEQILEL